MRKRRYGHNKAGVIRAMKGTGMKKRLTDMCAGNETLVSYVTDDTVSLISRILQYSPCDRLTPRQVLDSPYFALLRNRKVTKMSNGQPIPIRRQYLVDDGKPVSL